VLDVLIKWDKTLIGCIWGCVTINQYGSCPVEVPIIKNEKSASVTMRSLIPERWPIGARMHIHTVVLNPYVPHTRKDTVPANVPRI